MSPGQDSVLFKNSKLIEIYFKLKSGNNIYKCDYTKVSNQNFDWGLTCADFLKITRFLSFSNGTIEKDPRQIRDVLLIIKFSTYCWTVNVNVYPLDNC